jgi:hypothetical protein
MSEKMMSLNFKNLDLFVANSENAVMMEMNDEGAREGKEHRLDVIVALVCCGPLHDQCQNVNQQHNANDDGDFCTYATWSIFQRPSQKNSTLVFSLGVGPFSLRDAADAATFCSARAE